ncbi:MAG: hypothetical protein MRQ07_04315 [Candidatus Midichloria sp.]|nr:hypothetical protein [Candidatus Midichloria sp.]
MTDNISTGSHTRNPFIYNQDLLNEFKQFAEVIVEENLTLLAVISYRLTVPGIIQKALGVDRAIHAPISVLWC